MALSLNTNLITSSQPTTVTAMKDLKIISATGTPLTGATINNNGLTGATGLPGHVGKTKGMSMLGMPLVSPLMMLPNPLLQMLSLKNEIAKQQQQQQQQQQQHQQHQQQQQVHTYAICYIY